MGCLRRINENKRKQLLENAGNAVKRKNYYIHIFHCGCPWLYAVQKKFGKNKCFIYSVNDNTDKNRVVVNSEYGN